MVFVHSRKDTGKTAEKLVPLPLPSLDKIALYVIKVYVINYINELYLLKKERGNVFLSIRVVQNK